MSELRGQIDRNVVSSPPPMFKRKPIGRPSTMKGQPQDTMGLKGDRVMRGMSRTKTPMKGQPK